MKKYDHTNIEKKWQKEWSAKKVYKTEDPSSSSGQADKPKYYVLDMFPYPSGEGLHVGHVKGYIATDAVSRMKRMQGFNVLHPMGFDAFGLPAENYALKTKTNPMVAVAKNVARYKKQLEIIGFDSDWSREINTTDPKYYKWTQWIFLKLFEKGLAYETFAPINWCPSCKTGLANEDVEDGRCERCSTLVEKKPMRQWVLKITDYADRLIKDLDAKRLPSGDLIETTENGEICFTQMAEPGAVKPDRPFVERDAVVAVVEHWSNGSFIVLKWKAVDWHTTITGGIEKGQTPEETARREITEETGYKNMKLVKQLDSKVHAKFFHVQKNENRNGHFTSLHFKLVNDERDDVGTDEKAKHEVIWVAKDKVKNLLTAEAQKYEWCALMGEEYDLMSAIPLLDWPESIKEAQRNWIGRSEGVNFKTKVKDMDMELEMYNSVPQTFCAETFTVIAPDHPLLAKLVKGAPHEKVVLEFARNLVSKRSVEGYDQKAPEGIFTGRYVENFAGTGRDLPIWVASYVLAEYGTGIVNASAHDERDFAFAKKYDIPLHPVMFPEDKVRAKKIKNLEEGYFRDPNAVLAEPEEFKGRRWGEARQDIIDFLVKKEYATRKVNYKLRDWVFSRQRYWGEPFPIFHDGDKIVPVPEKELPVELPKVAHYEPTGTGESPLAGISKWVNVKVGTGKNAKILKRETNTMPQWAGSSWYYLRYMDPKNSKALVDPKKEKYWNEVDYYVGGAEHATRHLIYARFWHKFLYDIGVVSTVEPFKKLQSVGLVMAEDGRKMSKRWGNVVNPDDVISTYGADTMRVYEMFMGPFDQTVAWSTTSIIGSRRFLERAWKLADRVSKGAVLSREADVVLNKTIKKVSEDIGVLRHNTAVSSLMILSNELEKADAIPREAYETFLKLLAPLAPHITEELWMNLGNKKSIHLSAWPLVDESKLVESEVTIVVQVNGRVRASFTATKGSSKDALEKTALDLDDVKKWVGENKIEKVIVVPDKLVSIVLKN